MDKPYFNNGAHDALNRLRRAANRGTGCHLTADMIAGLSTTFLAEVWEDDDPRPSDRSEEHL